MANDGLSGPGDAARSAANAAKTAKTALKAAKALKTGAVVAGGVGSPIVVVVGFIAVMVLVAGAFLIALTGTAGIAIAQQQQASSTVTPMPDICSTVSNGPANYLAIINAANVVVTGAPFNSTTCKKPNARVLTLLAMAWVDSQWGTSWNTGLQTAGSTGADVAAAAAMKAGFTGQNLITITAAAGSESDFGANPGPIAPGCNTSGYCGMWQIGKYYTTEAASPSGMDGQHPDSNLTDMATMPDVNAQYAFILATKGNPNASQQAIAYELPFQWQSISNGAYEAFIPQATQAVNAVEGGALPADESGVILMATTKWAAAGITNANNAALAPQEISIVNQDLAPASPGTPTTTQLQDFYTAYGAPDLTAAVISSHVSIIQQVVQIAAAGGGLGGQIAALAKTFQGDTQFPTPISKQVPGLCTWSNCSADNGEWCGDFASLVWHDAGVPGIVDLPGAIQFEAWAQTHSTWTQVPAVGDVVVWGPLVNGGASHASIVVAVNSSGWIETVDGNYLLNGTSYYAVNELPPGLSGFYNPKNPVGYHAGPALGFASP